MIVRENGGFPVQPTFFVESARKPLLSLQNSPIVANKCRGEEKSILTLVRFRRDLPPRRALIRVGGIGDRFVRRNRGFSGRLFKMDQRRSEVYPGMFLV